MNETDAVCGSVAPSPPPNHFQPTHNSTNNPIYPTTPDTITINANHNHITTIIYTTYDNYTNNVIYITDSQVLTYDYTINIATNYCYVYTDYQVIMYLFICIVYNDIGSLGAHSYNETIR